MIRRTRILTTAALLAVCVVPAYADGKVIQEHPTAAPASQSYQDLRSPDARDAGRTPVQVPTPVVEIREVPGSGFDWGDAGIGAAGMLALFSIAAGVALTVGARRRRGVGMPAH
jgi:hypothetical protein